MKYLPHHANIEESSARHLRIIIQIIPVLSSPLSTLLIIGVRRVASLSAHSHLPLKNTAAHTSLSTPSIDHPFSQLLETSIHPSENQNAPESADLWQKPQQTQARRTVVSRWRMPEWEDLVLKLFETHSKNWVGVGAPHFIFCGGF